MEILGDIAVVMVAFVVGSLPTGYLVARASGLDIRTVGSGNIGATNVVRSLSPWAGRAVFLIDLLKGLLPTLFAPALMPNLNRSTAQMIACFGVILGHNYTPWLGFKGGKGFAASMGGFLAICAPAQLISAAAWVAVFFLWRYVSLASIISATLLPVLVLMFKRDWTIAGFAVLVSVVTLLRHRSNFARLRTGTEYRFNRART